MKTWVLVKRLNNHLFDLGSRILIDIYKTAILSDISAQYSEVISILRALYIYNPISCHKIMLHYAPIIRKNYFLYLFVQIKCIIDKNTTFIIDR